MTRAPKICPALLAGLVIIAISAMISGCGAGHQSTRVIPTVPTTSGSQPTSAQSQTFVYVASFNQPVTGATSGGGISQFMLNSDGSLTRIAGSPFVVSTNSPISLAADPKARFLFAGGGDGIQTFTISPNGGALSHVAITSSGWHAPLVVDPTGRFLYAGINGGIEAFSIGSTGALTTLQTVNVDAFEVATGLGEDPGGKFLYLSNRERTAVLSVDSNNGMLSLVSSVPAAVPGNNGPLGVDPGGKFVYVPSVVRTIVYANNAGSLEQVQIAMCGCISDFPGSSIVVHPAGKFLYENVSTPGVVLGFAIAADGTLTRLPGSPFPTTGTVTNVALDPAGSFGFAPQYNIGSQSTVAVFSVDSTSGALAQLSSSPVPLDVPPPAIPSSVVVIRVPAP